MGKVTRNGAAVGALALAGSLAFGASATANIDPGSPTVDGDTDVVAGINAPKIWRFADVDRVSTAIQAAERTTINEGQADEGWGQTVIIANSEVYADALAATPYADAIDAPVLLSKPGNSIDGRVLAYISGKFSNVLLVGGTDVFGAGAVAELESADFNVTRADGANRYQTAIELAEMTVDVDQSVKNIFLASGTDFPDALSAGAAAANNSGVVLLTKGSDGIDGATFSAITLNKIIDASEHNSTVAIGGPAAAAAAKGNAGGDPIEVNKSVVGGDRYETAVMVAETYFYSGTTNAAIASGQNFPDGVVAGAFASNVDGPLLLTKEGSLTKVTKKYFEDNRNLFNTSNVVKPGNIFVFGGVNSISKKVSEQLGDLEWNY